jgi:glutamate--cysteine ligase
MSSHKTTIVPHLTTALNGPLELLERHLLQHQLDIEAWLRQQWQKTPPPIYGSVDLRNAGFKLAPVDMNLFPAGFNNLNLDFVPLCIQAVQDTVEKCDGDINRILLLAESHTRNLFYLESLSLLHEIILKAGFDVRIGSLMDGLKTPQTIDLPSGRSVYLEPIKREGDRLMLDDFNPCFIWLNNDLSDGIPEILQGIEQEIRPPANLSWSNRLKSKHFYHYQIVAEEFAKLIDIDSWLINPLFCKCEGIDFLRREGMSCAMNNAANLLEDIQFKYDKYNIKEKPFVVVKADAGTYGMGVMTIKDPEELATMNRKQRTKMSMSKGGKAVDRIILQEGVYTFETLGETNAVAEPVVYMIGHHVVGGFYRVHEKRGVAENLNAPGMHFKPLAFAECCNNPDCHSQPGDCKNRFYAYGVIARLSLLAAAREEAEGDKDEN